MDMTEYLLTLITEEALEIAHRATKASRFGLDEVQPGQDQTNTQRMVGEYVDLVTTFMLLEQHLGVTLLPSGTERREMIDAKIEKIQKFMEYSRQLGVLKD